VARLIPNKNPLDLEDRKAIGFGFPINGNAVFVPTYETKDQIKANLINYLLTNKGERYFRPNFGSDLRNLVFGEIEDMMLDDLISRIQNDVSFYFPEVKIKDIKIPNIQPDEHLVNFNLVYIIEIFGIEDEINILLQ